MEVVVFSHVCKYDEQVEFQTPQLCSTPLKHLFDAVILSA